MKEAMFSCQSAKVYVKQLLFLFLFFVIFTSSVFASGSSFVSSVIMNAPTNLVATGISPSQIQLTWIDNANNEAGYYIEQKNSSGVFNIVGFVNANVTSFTVTNLPNYTSFTFKVNAANGSDRSGYSNDATGTTFSNPPAAPTNLTATPVSSSAIQLTWTDNSNNENGFYIEVVDKSMKTWVGANVTSYTFSNLENLTSYTFVVYASNGGDKSGNSNNAIATTLSNPPAAPTNLAATGISPSSIQLIWTDNAANDNGYYIEQMNLSGVFNIVGYVRANITTFTVTNLPNLSSFTFRVNAVNGGDRSGYSNNATGTTLSNPPAAPTNLTATPISSSAIQLNWTDNANNEGGFYIEIVNTTLKTFVGANVTSYNYNNLSINTPYIFRVYAANGGDKSGYSNNASATVPLAPSAPTNLAATVTLGQVNLVWTDNATNEAGYKVEINSGSGYSEIATVGANITTYSSTGLSVGASYSFKVRAFNVTGNSAYSNEAPANIPAKPAAPSNLNSSVMSATEINLVWVDNANNEDGFKIEMDAGTGNFTEIGSVGPNMSAFSCQNLQPCTDYIFRVHAYNSGGNSGYTSEAIGRTYCRYLKFNTLAVGSGYTYTLSGQDLPVSQFATGQIDSIPLINSSEDAEYYVHINSGSTNNAFDIKFIAGPTQGIRNVQVLKDGTYIPFKQDYFEISQKLTLLFIPWKNSNLQSSLISLVLKDGLLLTPNLSPFDVLKINGLGQITQFRIKIYTLSGILVFDTTDKTNFWNGKDMNTNIIVPKGVYKYTIQADALSLSGQFIIDYP